MLHRQSDVNAEQPMAIEGVAGHLLFGALPVALALLLFSLASSPLDFSHRAGLT